MEKSDGPTRKSMPPIKVYCLPSERNRIAESAEATGLSMSTYLLNVGMGYQVRGILDHKQIEALVRINGDLGRLGGLLKLWLTDDVRTAAFGESTIRALLSKIESTQYQMQDVMREIVMPDTKPDTRKQARDKNFSR